ncbi:MAG: hypothetical protein ACRDT6_21915 [Micromonosporaceae bacterium]
MRRVAILALFLAVVSGCTAAPETAAPRKLDWQKVTLPMPAGPGGRLAVRDAVHCADQWYVLGGVFTAGGESYPAGWRSADGKAWTPLEFAPKGYWGQRHIIFSGACRDGRLALVGAKSGGAHGNPRVSTWYQDQQGRFVEVIAAFELYGGPHAVNVGPIAAGESGWIIAGNRTSGAAVWTSPDATEFTLTDADPQLASDDRADTAAVHLTYADGGWTVVGSAQLAGRVPRAPIAWHSPDGATWQRQQVPYGDDYADLQRVASYRDGLVAVGLRGDTYGLWHRKAGAWRQGDSFGAVDTDGSAAPFVAGLATLGQGLVVSVSDSVRHRLWRTPDGETWHELAPPAPVGVGGEKVMSVAAADSTLVVLADNADGGTAWLAQAG